MSTISSSTWLSYDVRADLLPVESFPRLRFLNALTGGDDVLQPFQPAEIINADDRPLRLLVAGDDNPLLPERNPRSPEKRLLTVPGT